MTFEIDDDGIEVGPPGHERVVYYEGDSDLYCVCGKWLEQTYYEFPDHIRDVLKRPEYWAKRAEGGL